MPIFLASEQPVPGCRPSGHEPTKDKASIQLVKHAAAAANILENAPKTQACLDTDPWTGKHFPNQNRTAEVLPALHYLCLKAELKVPGFASEQNQPQLYRKDVSHSNCSWPGFFPRDKPRGIQGVSRISEKGATHDCKLQGREFYLPTHKLASPGAITHLSIFPLFFKALHVYNKALLLCNQPSEICRESVGVIQQPGSVTCRKRAKQSPLMFHETLLPHWL